MARAPKEKRVSDLELPQEQRELLCTLIEQHGEADLIRWIRENAAQGGKKQSRKTGRPAAPKSAKRIENLLLFLEVGMAMTGPFDPKPDRALPKNLTTEERPKYRAAKARAHAKLDAAISIVAKKRKLGFDTAKKYYERGRAEHLARQQIPPAVFPNSPRQKIADRIAASIRAGFK